MSPRRSVAGQTKHYSEHHEDLVQQLRAEIAAPPVVSGVPAVVLMMGLPGSGKTHSAQILAARLGAAHVASDELRSRLFIAASYTLDENAMIFRCLDRLLDDLLAEGHRVIVDATHLTERSRAATTATAARRAVPVVAVRVVADEAGTRARLARRMTSRAPGDHSDADERVWARMAALPFEEPDAGYLVVRNGPELASDLELVIERLEAVCARGS